MLREARFQVSPAAVMGALLVVAVGVVGFGGRVLLAEQSSAPVAAVEAATGGDDVGAGEAGGEGVVERGDRSAFEEPSSAASAVPGSAVSTSQVVVHVVGEVREPGLVRLPPGSRVADAVAAAGGATEDGDLASVNLARPAVDGEQIRVPRPGESVPPPPGAGGGTAGAGPGGLVNLNTADQAALETLPGIGPALAGRILAWRTEHGRFTTVAELGEVSGIGEKTLADLRDKVTV